MIKERLSQPDTKKGWILDGFPRNVSQAAFLEKLLQELQLAADCVLNLEVPDEVLVERLLARKRKDDNETTIRRRLEVYHQDTVPVISFYSDRDTLKAVNGNNSLENVTTALKAIIDQS